MGSRLQLSRIEIHKIGLRPRAVHALNNARVTTMENVLLAGRTELSLVPGFGRAGLAQLEQIMADNGVTWESNPIDCLWGKPTRRRKPVQTKADAKLWIGSALKPVVPTDVGTLAGVPRDEPEKVREANGWADKLTADEIGGIDQWGAATETASEAAAFVEPADQGDSHGEDDEGADTGFWKDPEFAKVPGSTADDMAAVDASIEEQATLKLLLQKNALVERLNHELEHAGRFRACAEQQAAFLSEQLTRQFTRLAGLRMFNGELTAQAAMTDIQANVEATDRVLHQILLQFDVNQQEEAQ